MIKNYNKVVIIVKVFATNRRSRNSYTFPLPIQLLI